MSGVVRPMALPLKLTEEQLTQVMRMAGAVPRELRGQFLQFVADRLPAQPGDGEVFTACAAAQKAVLWQVQREAS